MKGESFVSRIYSEKEWKIFRDRVPEKYKDLASSLEYAIKANDQDYVVAVFSETIEKARAEGETIAMDSLESKLRSVQVENKALAQEVERLKKELKKQAATANMRKEIDLESLYTSYKETKSYRATGLQFNLAGKTVKKYLLDGGYIKE